MEKASRNGEEWRQLCTLAAQNVGRENVIDNTVHERRPPCEACLADTRGSVLRCRRKTLFDRPLLRVSSGSGDTARQAVYSPATQTKLKVASRSRSAD